MAKTKKTHAQKLASASFFCGLGSLVLLILTGLPAIILGRRSIRMSRMQGRPRSRLAVTGIVFGCISFLTTTLVVLDLLGLAKRWRYSGRYLKATAREDCTRLVEGIEKYRSEYQVLPLPTSRQPHLTNSGQLIDILIGNSPAENSRSIVFLPSGRWNFRVPEQGPGAILLDPWGNPYSVEMDVDGDGEIEDPILPGRRVRGKLALVWSAGPDGLVHPGDDKHPDNEDNIYSWR